MRKIATMLALSTLLIACKNEKKSEENEAKTEIAQNKVTKKII